MKNLYIILVMLVAMNVSAQWQTDVRLTNDTNTYTSYNNAWCVASSGSVVHVVWFDPLDGGGNTEIYYKHSSDAGLSWGTNIRLTNNTAISSFPSVTVSGMVVHVVWQDLRDGNWDIYYKRSTDGGVNWGADTRLTNNSAESEYPSVAVSGFVVNVVWQDYRDGGEIYYKRSTDAGASWGADMRLTNNNTVEGISSVAALGSTVHIVWMKNRDGNYKIYYKRSTDGGVNWGADTRLTNDTNYSEFPSIAVSGSDVYVTWGDYRDGNAEIYYKRSTDLGVSWGADIRLTNASGSSEHQSVTVSGSAVHVVWRDNRDGNFEIYYKRNPTGNVGIQNISTETPSKYSLSQNYPNPFNPTTNIKFTIVNSGNVKLVVYDIQGREVQTLVNESLRPGTYEVSFDGSRLNNGVYFYKLVTDGFTETKKMLLIK